MGLSRSKGKWSLIVLLSAMFTSSVLYGVYPGTVHAAGPSEVSINVDASVTKPITGAKRVGVNMEMSMTSDAMWEANGNWMEETFKASGMNMMRWGYDAWAFDWEQEIPLSPNKYWGALNTKDAQGTFGLQEFIAFSKRNNIIPFVMIPIESLDTIGGQASLQKVKELTASMAQYMNAQGITNAYFDMGNEPWNNGARNHAAFYGSLFQEFQSIVKAVNPNYKLVFQRAPQNILWNSWNSTAINAAQGYFDAYDDHRYSFMSWNNYFDRNNDAIFTAGSEIPGKEPILGEFNIGWTPIQDNWDEGHVRDMGGSMALLNGMLGMINDNKYNYMVSWPSHYPSKASVPGATNNAFGWFNLDSWYNYSQTERLTGPMLAHYIVNQNVLENSVKSTSNASKVRTFAYTNSSNTELKLIVINKWDPTNLNISIPAGYNAVNAMVLKGNNVWDTKPTYTSHIQGDMPVTGTSFVNAIPGESVVVYTFFNDPSVSAPDSFMQLSPQQAQTEVSTAKAFEWAPAAGATNYRLVVSKHADFSAPVIDVFTGYNTTRYQSATELDRNQLYYWKVEAINKSGSTNATNQGLSFMTAGGALQQSRIWNNNSKYIAHGANWNTQTSSGSYQDDDMSSNVQNSYVEFRFTGTQAKIYGIKGNWCGLADVQVDFGSKQTIDTYAQTTQAQAELFDTGVLPYGTHTITLTVRGEKNPASSGAWIEFDKVVIEDSSGNPQAEETIVWNDDNPNISKFSTWTHQSVLGSYHDDDTSSNTWQASMSFTFNGTHAKIFGLKAAWTGIADIQIDGTTVATIDTYSPNTQFQALLFDTGVLTQGNHTVKMIVKSAKNSASSGRWIEYDKVEWY